MNIEAAIQELKALNQKVPRPLRLPSENEVSAIEQELGIQFHPDYRQYLLRASDVVLGTLEPAEITEPESHTYLPSVVADAREMGVPDELLPFCEDNGDYYCLRKDGSVVFWSHNGSTNEAWPDLAAWVIQVWVAENA